MQNLGPEAPGHRRAVRRRLGSTAPSRGRGAGVLSAAGAASLCGEQEGWGRGGDRGGEGRPWRGRRGERRRALQPAEALSDLLLPRELEFKTGVWLRFCTQQRPRVHLAARKLAGEVCGLSFFQAESVREASVYRVCELE